MQTNFGINKRTALAILVGSGIVAADQSKDSELGTRRLCA